MKIDMSSEAISRRLEQVRELNRICLSLAKSSAGREIIKKHPANEKVRRTAMALGFVRPDEKPDCAH